MIVGIEVGGTFTDLVLIGDAGQPKVFKLPSTPADPGEAAVLGMQHLLAQAHGEAGAVTELLHGSTIAANALIQRRGANTVLLTTCGFRDVLFIQKQDKTCVYDMFYQKPKSLIDRDRVFEVEERLDARGQVVKALDIAGTEQLIEHIVALYAPDSIAVCLLHAYREPMHERAVGRLINQRFPSIRVSLSSDVAPEHREYERASTTLIDAYIGPAVDGYLRRFAKRAAAIGNTATPLIMQSNGGVVPLQTARKRAANMFLSGPAAAVTAAIDVARREGVLNVISVDIGGTSCDVCLISGGVAHTTLKGTSEFNVEGLPLNVVMTDIVTIGAGGGSIAWCDEGGMLQVGPQSAGADPGPACYGKGGEQLTLTDAMLLLGLLDASVPLPGDIVLDVERARVCASRLGCEFGLGALEVAASVYRIAVANMAQAVRRVSVQRGHDPRDYVLLPCGGAGPLIATALADEVGMEQILLPPHPGIFSAMGLAVADIRIDYVHADGAQSLGDLNAAALRQRVRALARRAEHEFTELGYGTAALQLEFAADARYQGQGYELRVPFCAADVGIAGSGLVARFHEMHERLYGHSFAAGRVELISLRLTARLSRASIGDHVQPRFCSSAPTLAPPPPACTRAVYSSGVQTNYACYTRDGLAPGFEADGPVILIEDTSSTPIPRGWRLAVRPSGSVVIKPVPGARGHFPGVDDGTT